MKHNVFSAICLSLVLVITPGLSQAESEAPYSLAASLPEDTATYIRADLQAVMASPLGGELLVDLRRNYTWINWFLGAAFGFNLKQIDQIWVGNDANDQGVMVFQGAFKPKRVTKRMQRLDQDETPITYPGVIQVNAFEDREGNAQLAALLSDNLIALGDRVKMEAMLSSWQTRNSSSADIPKAVTTLANNNAEIAAVLREGASFTGEQSSTLPVLETALFEIRFTEDMAINAYALALDEQRAEGLKLMTEGMLLIGQSHPDVVAEPSFLKALQEAELKRTVNQVDLRINIAGDAVLRAARASGNAAPEETETAD